MWELTRFGNDAAIILPRGKIKGNYGTFDTVDTVMLLAGGIPYDTYGNNIAPSKPEMLQYTAHLYDNTPENLETAYRALTGKRGHVERLFRTWHISGKSEWIYARLKSVSAPYDSAFSGRNLARSLTCTWVPLSPHWNGARHGSGWELDAGEYLDSGLYFDENVLNVFPLATTTTYMTVTSLGNVASQEINLVITPSGSNITYLNINKSVPGVGETPMFQFIGPIYLGSTLHINIARKSITYDGTSDCYQYFQMGALNPYEDWLLMEPGENFFSVTRTGGNAGSTIAFNFYDGWA